MIDREAMRLADSEGHRLTAIVTKAVGTKPQDDAAVAPVPVGNELESLLRHHRKPVFKLDFRGRDPRHLQRLSVV